MSQKLRDSIYGVAVAIGGLLVALGIIDAATESLWLGLVTALLGAASAAAPVIAHLHLGAKGVDNTGHDVIEGQAVDPAPAVQADSTDVQGHPAAPDQA